MDRKTYFDEITFDEMLPDHCKDLVRKPIQDTVSRTLTGVTKVTKPKEIKSTLSLANEHLAKSIVNRIPEGRHLNNGLGLPHRSSTDRKLGTEVQKEVEERGDENIAPSASSGRESFLRTLPTQAPYTFRQPSADPFAKCLKYIERDPEKDESRALSIAAQKENIINTPLFTAAVNTYVDSDLEIEESATELIPQYGLLGMAHPSQTRYSRSSALLEQFSHDDYTQMSSSNVADSTEVERLVFTNLNMPWSTFICGLQGSGKSHSLSCLLENYLIAGLETGKLLKPLAGIMFHYDSYTSSANSQICEAAYLCSSGLPVTVLVSPSNIWSLKTLYSNLPGLPEIASRPQVLPLYLAESQLSIARMLKLMAIDQTAESVPLYMEIVMNIVREMATEGPSQQGFSYTEFRRRLDSINWIPGQNIALNLRLKLLESFLVPSTTTKTTRPAAAARDIWSFEPGTLTIVDLSDPCVSTNEACAVFSICLSIFMEDRARCGRVVALDEAHKFLSQPGEAQILTSDLLSVIRQQRHTGTRVLIATQEPTLSPRLMELSNVTIIHRFLSPSWYEVIKKHLAISKHQSAQYSSTLFDTIVTLRTGEALVFCPTALVTTDRAKLNYEGLKPLGNDYLRVDIRTRLSTDGGKSIAATTSPGNESGTVQRLRHVDVETPMHIVKNIPTAPRVSSQASVSVGATRRIAIPVKPVQPKPMQTIADLETRIFNELKKCAVAKFARDKIPFEKLTKSMKANTYQQVGRNLSLKPGSVSGDEWGQPYRNLTDELVAQSAKKKQ